MIKAIAPEGGQSRRRRRLVTEIGRCGGLGGWDSGQSSALRIRHSSARACARGRKSHNVWIGLRLDLAQFFLVFKSCGYLRLQVLYEFLGRIAKAAHRHDREEQFRRKGRCDQENGRWLRARVRRRAKVVAFPEA